MRFCLALIACLFIVLPARAQEAAPPVTDEARTVYERHGGAIYQVQVIDLASGKKSAIGSGFQFTRDGLMATNYHVVAGAIRRPQDNRLEYLHDRGERGGLTILAADVVHDLAILKMEKPGADFVALGGSALPKGTKIFALGNPHDIGFTIVEGLHNGPLRETFIDKIHFSGSLNPGMSGGPALGRDGRVVGINVSTAGNQISFLVPVEHLKALHDRHVASPGAEDFLSSAAAHIGGQLLESQARNMETLLSAGWESMPFGPLVVPGRIHPALKCWGARAHEDGDPFRHYASLCETQDTIFLDDGFHTGTYGYRYDYIADAGGMNPFRFFNYYERQYAGVAGEGAAREEDVTDFACETRFVDLASRRWKTSFCVRRYRQYADIWDMWLFMAMVGGDREGVLVSLNAEGVSRDSARAFARRFMEEIKAPPPAPEGGGS